MSSSSQPIASECGLTPRSSRAPTAGHQAQASGTVYIFRGLGLASHRWCRLSSNVRHHNRQQGVSPSQYPASIASYRPRDCSRDEDRSLCKATSSHSRQYAGLNGSAYTRTSDRLCQLTVGMIHSVMATTSSSTMITERISTRSSAAKSHSSDPVRCGTHKNYCVNTKARGKSSSSLHAAQVVRRLGLSPERTSRLKSPATTSDA